MTVTAGCGRRRGGGCLRGSCDRADRGARPTERTSAAGERRANGMDLARSRHPRAHRGRGGARRPLRLRRRWLREDERATTSAVERYDIARDRWRRVRSMPVALNHPAAAAYRGDVYVVGGYTRRRRPARARSPPSIATTRARNRWTRLPTPRPGAAALAVGVIGGKLYAAGGRQRRQGALTTLERLRLRAPALVARARHGDRARAPGRRRRRRRLLRARRARGRAGQLQLAERYLPRSSRWERLPDMRKPRGGIARRRGRPARGRRRRRGGRRDDRARSRMYDPRRAAGRRLPDMRTPRHGLGGVSRGRRVYAIEGGPRPGFFFSNAIEALDVSRRRASPAHLRSASAPRCPSSRPRSAPRSALTSCPPSSSRAGDRRGRPSGRPSAPPRRVPSFTYQAVNLPSSRSCRATRPRPSRCAGPTYSMLDQSARSDQK